MRKMSEFGDLIALAAHDRAPFRLTHYARDLASLSISSIRIARCSGWARTSRTRLALCDATRIVRPPRWASGISSPQRM
ncbi:MAG: DALR anticodon-binding domain-containing protein [Slackia sp.]